MTLCNNACVKIMPYFTYFRVIYRLWTSCITINVCRAWCIHCNKYDFSFTHKKETDLRQSADDRRSRWYRRDKILQPPPHEGNRAPAAARRCRWRSGVQGADARPPWLRDAPSPGGSATRECGTRRLPRADASRRHGGATRAGDTDEDRLSWCLVNPFTDKQLNLLGIVPKQVWNFSSLSIFCLGCKTISRRAACRLIVLYPKQNVESELKWQTC